MIHFHPSSRSMRFFLYGQGDLLHAALHTAVTPPHRETPPSRSDTKCWRRLPEWQTPTTIGLGRRTLNSLRLLSRTNKKGTHEFFRRQRSRPFLLLSLFIETVLHDLVINLPPPCTRMLRHACLNRGFVFLRTRRG